MIRRLECRWSTEIYAFLPKTPEKPVLCITAIQVARNPDKKRQFNNQTSIMKSFKILNHRLYLDLFSGSLIAHRLPPAFCPRRSPTTPGGASSSRCYFSLLSKNQLREIMTEHFYQMDEGEAFTNKSKSSWDFRAATRPLSRRHGPPWSLESSIEDQSPLELTLQLTSQPPRDSFSSEAVASQLRCVWLRSLFASNYDLWGKIVVLQHGFWLGGAQPYFGISRTCLSCLFWGKDPRCACPAGGIKFGLHTMHLGQNIAADLAIQKQILWR